MTDTTVLDRLTERQRELLHLVGNGVTASKEIARLTGLAPASIDTLLQGAGKELGVRGRKAAAQRYAQLVENSQNVSQFRTEGFEPHGNSGFLDGTGIAGRGIAKVLKFLRGPPIGGSEKRLGWDQTAMQILRVALIGMLAIWTLALFTMGFYRTFG